LYDSSLRSTEMNVLPKALADYIYLPTGNMDQIGSFCGTHILGLHSFSNWET